MGRSAKPPDASSSVPSLIAPSTLDMQAESPSDERTPARRTSEDGLELLKLASISQSKPGQLYRYQTGDPHDVRQLFISTHEQALDAPHKAARIHHGILKA
jgi:hypothetical protein